MLNKNNLNMNHQSKTCKNKTCQIMVYLVKYTYSLWEFNLSSDV
jgi:hypothetical protein